MRKILVSFVAVAVVLVAGVGAQGKPNFTGKWTQIEGGPTVSHHAVLGTAEGPGAGRSFFFFNANEPGAPGPDYIGGQNMELAQDAATLKVTYLGKQRYTLTYALDGSVNRNAPPAAPESVATSIATWEGNTLVINSDQSVTTPQGPASVYIKQMVSLAADGTLIVEMRRGTGATAKAVYKKN